MAFPVVQTTNTSSDTSTTQTNHVVNLPSGISSGDLLLVFFGMAFPDSNGRTYPGGWTEFAWAEQAGGADAGLSVAWRKATGTEGSTITVTTDLGTRSAHVAFRITGHEDPTTQAPQSATDIGTNSNTDSPNLAPTGGAKDYLWFSAGGRTHDDVSVISAPTNYGNVLEASGGTGSGGILTHTARRELNASSEDPGAWSGGDVLAEWASVTIAVHPQSGTEVTDNQPSYLKGRATTTDSQIAFAGGGVFPFTDTFTGSNDDPWDADKWTTSVN